MAGRSAGAPRALGRSLIVWIALLATFGAAALAPGARAAPENTEPRGLAGPYLAAQVAAWRGDVRAAAEYFARAAAAAPGEVELLARALLYAVADGRVTEAVPLAERLIALHPAQPLARLVLAADALVAGDAARARAILDPEKAERALLPGQLVRAWAAFDLGEAETTRGELEALIGADDADATTRLVAGYHLALLEAALGNDEAALAALDRARADSERESLRIARVRAGILARLGRFEEARKLLAEQLANTLSNPRIELLLRELEAGRAPPPPVRSGREGAAEALLGVASFFTRERDRAAGLAYAQLAAHLDPGLVEARLLVAEMLYQAGQYALAVEAFEKIPPDAPEGLEAAIERAQALFELDRRDEALVLLRETARAHPDAINVHVALGTLLHRAERYAEAAEAYSAAIALVGEPERRHWTLFYRRGIAYERAGQWEKAEADFFKALELEPDQPLVLNYLGYSWVELGKNLDEARRMIEKAVEQRPNDGFIVDSLGWVLFRLGDFEGAVKHLERAVELEPVDPVINDHYGDALWMVGRRKEARFQWKRALSFKPEEKDAERIRRKLAVGLDAVLAEEAAKGLPTIMRSENAAGQANDGG